MSKTARAVLAFLALTLFSLPMAAQILARGNVYGGVSYGQFTEVVNRASYRGWEGSAEILPINRFSHLGFVLDGSGYYRSGISQYNFLGGARLSSTYGKWRPFIHGMGGIARINSSGVYYQPVIIDVGGGADYKIFFKNFSWRLQGDLIHSHYGNATQYDARVSTGIVWRF